jgi:hypothetical protein
MQTRQIMTPVLLPAAHHPPAAGQPPMCALAPPAPGLVTRFRLERLRCFPTCPDGGRDAHVNPPRTDGVVVIALIHTPALWRLKRGLRRRHGQALEGRADHRAGMTIGPRPGQAARHAAAGRRLGGAGSPRGAVFATGAAGGDGPITRQGDAKHAGLARDDPAAMRRLWPCVTAHRRPHQQPIGIGS